MLVLSRRKEEGITITVPASPSPTVIKIKMLSLEMKFRVPKAKISVEAPRRVIVDRDEIDELKKAEQQDASSKAMSAKLLDLRDV